MLKGNTQSHDFLIPFIQNLGNDRQQIALRQLEIRKNPPFTLGYQNTDGDISEPDPAEVSRFSQAVEDLIQQCLRAVASYWRVEKHDPWQSHPSPDRSPKPLDLAPQIQHDTVNRIVDIVDLAIVTCHTEVCTQLFADILKSPGSQIVKRVELYIPLITPLT